MAIHFDRVVLTDDTYPTDPQIDLPEDWQPKRIQLVDENDDPADDAFISFDGSEDIGHVLGGDTLASVITYLAQVGVRKIWLRNGTGGNVTMRVLVEQ